MLDRCGPGLLPWQFALTLTNSSTDPVEVPPLCQVTGTGGTGQTQVRPVLVFSQRNAKALCCPRVRPTSTRAELAGSAELVSDVEPVPEHGERKDEDANVAGCGLLCGAAPPLVGVVSAEV